MDLMTQSTSYAVLKKKYRDFVAPTLRINIEGVEIIEQKGAAISNLTVELTSGYAASSCSFDVIGEYLPAQTDFNPKGCIKQLEIGAKIEIELGYIATETVFIGLISEVSYLFEEDASPTIHVECMDVKCLLMKMQRLELVGEDTPTSAITAMLSEAPISSYINGKTVEIPESTAKPLAIKMESNYDFILRWARYYGCEFFVIAGKVYLRSAQKSSSPILTLTPDCGITTARLRLQGAELVKNVQVVGINPTNDEVVTGEAELSGRFGTGCTVSKMLNGTKRVYFDSQAVTANEVQRRAKVLMSGMTSNFGVIEIGCMGLPDIVPGRTIQISGLSDRAKGSFYVTEVRHFYGDDGFYTTLEGRRNSL